MGKIVMYLIALILMAPVSSYASSKVSVDMKYSGNEVSGKLRVNGEKYTLDSNNDIEIKTESTSDSTSSSVSVKSTVQGNKTIINNNSNLDLNIEHDAGPAPDPDSTIKVTVDGEDIYTVKDIGPGEEVDITYSTSSEDTGETNESVQDIDTVETETTDESPKEEAASLLNGIVELLDSIATFFRNLFS